MTKEQAIEWIKEIQGGSGVDRYKIASIIPRGSMAVIYWDDSMFTYGLEYGIIGALMIAFDIKKEEL